MLKKLLQWIKKLYRDYFWRAKNWINDGDKKRKKGQWKEAILSYDHAITIDSKSYQAWRKKGYTLSEIGNYDEALPCYEKAVRIKKDDADIWFEKASVLAQLGQYQAAINAYTNTLQFNPEFFKAWIFQGDLFIQIQQKETAIKCYEQALLFEPNNEKIKHKKEALLEEIQQDKKAEQLLVEAEDLYQQNQFEEVVKLYDKILEIKPYSELALCHQGYALLQLGEYKKALDSLDKALTIQEKNPDTWYFKGRTLENLGNFEGALHSFEKAIELNSKYYQAWDGRAIALMKLNLNQTIEKDSKKDVEEDFEEDFENDFENDFEEQIKQREEEAFNSWEKAFEIKPNYFQGWLNKGLILASKDQYEEAIISFKRANQLNSNYYHGKLAQARIDADFGRYKQALKTWDEVIEFYSEKVEYLENRALIKIDLTDELLNYAIKIYKALLDNVTVYAQNKRAIVYELIEKTLNLNPKCAKAWWYKAKAIKYSFDLSHLERDKQRLNCYFQALHFFNKGDKEYEEVYQEHLLVKNHFASDLHKDAEEHIKAGEFDEAIEELTQSIEIFKDLQEIEEIVKSYRLRGHLYTELKQYQEAIKDFDQALLNNSKNNYLTYCERGTTYQLLGDAKKAIEDYSLALEIKPNFDAYNSRGLLQIEQENFAEAIEDFNEAINFKPSEANCFYSRGFAKAQLNQNEEAMDDFLQAGELYRADDNKEGYKIAITAFETLKENEVSPDEMSDEVSNE